MVCTVLCSYQLLQQPTILKLQFLYFIAPQQPPSLPTREMAKKAKKVEEEAPKKGKKKAAAKK
mgnify:CR=1 FL=1